MTASERIQIREVLRQAQVQSVLALSATHASMEKRSGPKVLTRSAATRVAQEIDRCIAEEETARLLAISAALELLHDKPELYGVCEECGRSIPLARLRFSPWSSRCESHAELPIQ